MKLRKSIFKWNTCQIDKGKERKGKGLPVICPAHIGMFLTLIAIVVMQVWH